MRIALINGPNLGLLGRREPEVYGTDTLDDINGAVESLGSELGVEVETLQSNSEGAILDFLEEASQRVDGFLINPGGADAHERGSSRRVGGCGAPVRGSSPL